MKIGYARVSSVDQRARLQTDLKKAGCRTILIDQGCSGASTNRPELRKDLKKAKKGGVLMVWKIDRLSRSLSHLISLIEDLKSRGIGFRSLTDPIDTTSPQGLMIFKLLVPLENLNAQ